jgi:predicted nucleic acid-binding protein
MIYLDTSVGLAQLLAEDRVPPAALWEQPLVASRVIQYEIWTRLHARGLGASHGEAARDLLARVAFIELAPPVLERALAPFPSPVRTLDALHLASIEFLRAQRQDVTLATYDERMAAAADALGIPLYDLTESPAQNRGL